jgi:hypothetical protein
MRNRLVYRTRMDENQRKEETAFHYPSYVYLISYETIDIVSLN